MRRARLTLALLVGVMACGSPLELPREAASFMPPASYRVWWARTEACSGHTGRFERVRWYAVPPVPGDDRFAYRDEHGVAHLSYGMWDSNGSIYLSAVYLDQESLVRHEMLHQLLQRGDHPWSPFVDPCLLLSVTLPPEAP